MANTPFKMKGNPMQRNFGMESPIKGLTKGSGTHKDHHNDDWKKDEEGKPLSERELHEKYGPMPL
jgi:hypothetical protein